MYTITKKKGSANIIWDPKAEKPLCKFTQGFFSTSDKDIADRLAKLGHKVEGLAEKAEAKQEMAKGEGVDKESETYKMALDIVRSAYPEASDRIAEGQANVIYSMFTRAEERGILKVLGYKNAAEAMEDMSVARRDKYDPQRISEEQALKQAVNVQRDFNAKYELTDIDNLQDLVGSSKQDETSIAKAFAVIETAVKNKEKVTTKDLSAVFNFADIDKHNKEHIVLAKSQNRKRNNAERIAKNITISNTIFKLWSANIGTYHIFNISTRCYI